MEPLNIYLMFVIASVLFIAFTCVVMNDIYEDWIKVGLVCGCIMAISYLVAFAWSVHKLVLNGAGLWIAIGAFVACCVIGLAVFISKKFF